MITLRRKDYNTAIRLGIVLPVSNKADLYEATKLMGVQGCSKYNKAELCDIIEDLLLHDTLPWILTTLPKEEIAIVKKLVDVGPNTYVEVPMRKDDSFYRIQKMFFVVSYEDNENRVYHMVMPDAVRENCAKYIDRFISQKQETPTEDRYIPELMKPAVDSLHDMAMEYLERQGAPDEIKAVIGAMPYEDLLQMMGTNFQKPKTERRADKIQMAFLPAITDSTDVKIRKGTTTNYQVVTEATVLLVCRMPSGRYVNYYFLRVGPDVIKVAVCLGDVINSVYGRDVLKLRLMDFLPESAKYKFPYLYKILNERTLEDFDNAYLNTIGLNGMPKQWFVMQQLDDPDCKMWTDIRMHGPYSPACAKAVKAVSEMLFKIIDDIDKSGDVTAIEHLNRYLGRKKQETVSVTIQQPAKVKPQKKALSPRYLDPNTPITFFPAVTDKDEVQMWGEKYHEYLTESLLLSVTKHEKKFRYVYFQKCSNKIRVMCCLGDTLNSIYGYDALSRSVVEMLPKSFKKKYPYIFRLINGRASCGPDDAHIYALSINGPKQWFIVEDIKDVTLWSKLTMDGPFSDMALINAMLKVEDTVLKVLTEVYMTGDNAVLNRWCKYFGMPF